MSEAVLALFKVIWGHDVSRRGGGGQGGRRVGGGEFVIVVAIPKAFGGDRAEGDGGLEEERRSTGQVGD
jgi:hypothetical protein